MLGWSAKPTVDTPFVVRSQVSVMNLLIFRRQAAAVGSLSSALLTMPITAQQCLPSTMPKM